MSISVSVPVASGASGDRNVASRIKGVAVTLPCPSWCTQNHGLENHLFLEDFNHSGDRTDAELPNGEELFSAQLFSYPHCSVGSKVAIDDGETSFELTAEQAEIFADQLVTIASRIRGMARTIGGAR
jgi:hypothetical protein